MAVIIPDTRIGYKDMKGDVIQRPTYFATGEFWSKGKATAPTQVWFGAKSRFFYLLPVSVARIPHALHDEFTETVEPYARKMFPDWYKEQEEKSVKTALKRRDGDIAPIDSQNVVKSDNRNVSPIYTTPDTSDSGLLDEPKPNDITELLQQAIHTMTPEELQIILTQALATKKEEDTSINE